LYPVIKEIASLGFHKNMKMKESISPLEEYFSIILSLMLSGFQRALHGEGL
jgi:hypothetical protein